jgi:integrase
MAAQFAADKSRLDGGGYTIGEAVDKYIASKEAVLSPSTIRGYMAYRKNLGGVEALRVDMLTSADLQTWVSALSRSYSAKYVKNIYALVISAVAVVSDHSYRVTLPARKPLTYNVPTDDQVKALLDNAREDIRLAVALAAVGTLRRGEVCALRHRDVFRDKLAVYIHSDMILNKNNEWIYKDMPKTSDSVRWVTLPVELIDMIPEGEPEEFVIGSTPAAVSDAFARLRSRLGLKCRFHDLRHYAASILHAIGVPDQYIMERGGWATDGTLKAVYRNTLADQNKYFNDKAVEHFSIQLFNPRVE